MTATLLVLLHTWSAPLLLASLTPRSTDLPPELAARVGERPIPLGEFDNYLADRYKTDEVGRQALDQIIDERLVAQEAKRRGTTVTEREVSRRLEQLGRQVRQSGVASLEAYLQSQGVDYQDFMAALEKSLAHEKMARQDYGLAPGEKISEAKLRLWLKERRQRASVTIEGVGGELCARVNGQPVSRVELGRTLRKVLSQDDLHKALVELIGIVLIEQMIGREGIKLTKADLERELANREIILSRRYNVEKISLPELLQTDAATLMTKRRFRAEAALGKVVDIRYDRAALESFYKQHNSEFEARFGAQLEVSIIFIKAVIRPNEFIMRTFDQAEKELEKVKSQIIEGRPFADMAHIYSEHPSARSGGKLGYLRGNEPGMREVYNLATSLDPGEIGGPLRATDGVYLVLTTDRRPPPDFDDLLLEVRQAVRQQEYRSLFKDVSVEQRW